MPRTDLDGGVALKKLRSLYAKQSSPGCGDSTIDRSASREEAEHVLAHPEMFSTGTRKLAAQLLHRWDPSSFEGRKDWVQLSAVVDNEMRTERLAAIAMAWSRHVERNNMGGSDDEFLFLSYLIMRVAKYRTGIEKACSADDFNGLRSHLLSTCYILYEVRSEDVTHLFKAVLKLYSDEKSIQELFVFCMSLLPYDLSSNMLCLSFLITSNERIRSKIYTNDVLHDNLQRWTSCQTTATSAAPLVTALLVPEAMSGRVIELILKCLLSRKGNIRSNTVRCILARVVSQKGSLDLFKKLLEALETKWKETVEGNEDDNWPPQLWETEDITCIDVEWQWEEGEDVYWLRDRIVQAWLAIWGIVLKRYKNVVPNADSELLLAGLCWHLSEIRLTAFGILTQLTNVDDLIEEFLISNGDTSCFELSSLVKAHSVKFNFTESGRLAFETVQKSRQQKDNEDDENSKIYVPDDLGVIEKVPNIEISSRLEFLLKTSGSVDKNCCPTFPVLYKNLEAAGIHHRIFTKEIIDLLNQLVNSSSDNFQILADWLWQTTTRCRMKAVVDHGCNLVEELPGKHAELSEFYFEKAVSKLLDPTSTTRTLCLSRILWSSCATSTKLFQAFWMRVRLHLNTVESPSVLSRILKTFKLFYSKAQNELPAECTYHLFWFCLDIQNSSDYLVRSSATILFGFLVRSLTNNREIPLFCLLVSHEVLWKELRIRSENFADLTRPQRVLILSFLKRFTLYHEVFYCDSTLNWLSVFRDQLSDVVQSSPDIRERRFCIDVFIQFIPCTSWSNLLKRVEDVSVCGSMNEQANLYYMSSELIRLIGQSSDCEQEKEKQCSLPVDLRQSPYVMRVEKAREVTSRWIEEVNEKELMELLGLRLDLNVEDELPAQCAAMILCQIAKGIGSKKISGQVAESFYQECRRLLYHPVARVSSLISRVAVNLGLSTFFSQHYFLEKELRKWASDCSSNSTSA